MIIKCNTSYNRRAIMLTVSRTHQRLLKSLFDNFMNLALKLSKTIYQPTLDIVVSYSVQIARDTIIFSSKQKFKCLNVEVCWDLGRVSVRKYLMLILILQKSQRVKWILLFVRIVFKICLFQRWLFSRFFKS